MAPAPTMMMDSGHPSRARAWRLVMMRSPSISRPGMERARAPVARMMLGDSRTRPPGSTATRPGASSRPSPCTRSILFFFSKPWMPFTSRCETWRLRWMATAKSTCRLSKVKPNSLPRSSRLITSALRSSDLVGMQPQLRQTPPTSSRSTTAVRRPSCAARMPAT